MGVYVPNIKKPKHCTECYFVSRDQCELQDNSYDYDTFKEQRKHCPLIEIPASHGSLKEELEKKLYEYIDPFEVPGALKAFYDAMDRFTKGE